MGNQMACISIARNKCGFCFRVVPRLFSILLRNMFDLFFKLVFAIISSPERARRGNCAQRFPFFERSLT